jgi:macrodomain Ter protein organizer (MatP/YcbG family)
MEKKLRKEIKIDYETWQKIKLYATYKGITIKEAVKEITDYHTTEYLKSINN